MRGMLFPYRTLEGQVELQLVVPGFHVDEEHRSVNLTESEAASRHTVTVDARARVPLTELTQLGYRDVQALAVGRCGNTDLRQTWRLERSPDDPAVWTGSVALDRRQLRGETILNAVLTGTVDGVKHRYLASSEPWTLLVDESASRPLQGELPMGWLDFSTSDELKPYADEPFHLDLHGSVPTVYLNKRFERLPEVLPEKGQPPGPLRPMYETVRASIARSVWQGLLEASLAGISEPLDAEDGEPGWPPVRWQEDVVLRLLPHVYPDASGDELLRMAARARCDEQEARQLASRAMLVIQKEIVRDGTALRRALRALEDYVLRES